MAVNNSLLQKVLAKMTPSTTRRIHQWFYIQVHAQEIRSDKVKIDTRLTLILRSAGKLDSRYLYLFKGSQDDIKKGFEKAN